jgi:hypothetical protein
VSGGKRKSSGVPSAGDDEAPPRIVRALQALTAHGVHFVLIGGYAAIAHGSPMPTRDVDVCYARDDENLERLAAALRELRATLRGAPPDLPFQLDAKALKEGDHFTFSTLAGPLDCLGTPVGTSGFDDLNVAATEEEVNGLRIRVASLEDLMRMKRAAGRTKDKIALEWLGALRDELDEG